LLGALHDHVESQNAKSTLSEVPILSGSLLWAYSSIYLIRKISVVETVSSMTEITIESVFGVKALDGGLFDDEIMDDSAIVYCGRTV
jgi:hypothetical protein